MVRDKELKLEDSETSNTREDGEASHTLVRKVEGDASALWKAMRAL